MRKIYLCKLQSSANKSVWGFEYGTDFVCWWPSSQVTNDQWPCMITSAEMLLNHKMKIVHWEQSVKNLKWNERTRFMCGQIDEQMDEWMEKIPYSLVFLGKRQGTISWSVSSIEWRIVFLYHICKYLNNNYSFNYYHWRTPGFILIFTP